MESSPPQRSSTFATLGKRFRQLQRKLSDNFTATPDGQTNACLPDLRRSSCCMTPGTRAANKCGLELLEVPDVIECNRSRIFVARGVDVFLRSLETAQLGKPDAFISVGISGGSTPKPIFELLSTFAKAPEFNDRVNWDKVKVCLVDERYISADSPDSNQRMIQETLSIIGDKIPKENFIVPNTALPLEECIAEYQSRLLSELSFPLDVVTLGLGEDGHIASWFPPLPPLQQMDAGESLVAHTIQNKFAVSDRITLSLSSIMKAKKKIFFISGEGKVSVWNSLLSSNDPCEVRRQPLLQVVRSLNVTCVAYPPLSEVDRDIEVDNTTLSIVIFGASGDLAKKKTYPALFSLYCEGLLPQKFHIVGYARSSMDFEEFWSTKILPNLTALSSYFSSRKDIFCKGSFGFVDRFKKHCFYCSGPYEMTDSPVSPSDFSEGYVVNSWTAKLPAVEHLSTLLCRLEVGGDFGAPKDEVCAIGRDALCAAVKDVQANRLFYLALPPGAFLPAVRSARTSCWSTTGWNRVIVEKPFGKDLESSNTLSSNIMSLIKEDETFRIDHYLGKEMVLNLLSLRFANLIFSPLWHHGYIQSVKITFKEDIGVSGRAGYFDEYGILRDVMQNHLLQMLSLVAMERPVSLQDDDLRDEKVKVLRQISPIQMENLVIGQYEGYTDEPGVPRTSRTPTFATAILHVDNERWHKVPFILKAGKALQERRLEIRIQLKEVPGGLFGDKVAQNEIVILVQPQEAVYMKMVTKKPGLGPVQLEQTELDLSVMSRFMMERIPDAYERLLHDAVKGSKENFVRTDELQEAWRIFTPVLKEMENLKVKPIVYEKGSRGPIESYDLLKRAGYRYFEGYVWNRAGHVEPNVL